MHKQAHIFLGKKNFEKEGTNRNKMQIIIAKYSSKNRILKKKARKEGKQ